MKHYILIILTIFIFQSCQSQKGPTIVLKEFLSYRFKQDQNKEDVLKYITGSFKEKVLALSESDIKDFLNSSKLVKKKLKIEIKKCDESKCFLTYVLSYKQNGIDNEAYEIDVKKIAELHLIDDTWKIENVSNIKSYIEAQKGLDIEI